MNSSYMREETIYSGIDASSSSDIDAYSSMATSVLIRVTPEHYSLLSGTTLFIGFLLTIIFASWQVRREHVWMASKRSDLEQGVSSTSGEAEVISSADITRSMVSLLSFYLSCQERTI
jgi:hypothetical protein